MPYLKTSLSSSLIVSIIFHAIALFGITFVMPDPRSMASDMQMLQVVLVNSKSKTKPNKADALAQHNLDGGGNTEDNRVAKTSFPTLKDSEKFTPEQLAKHVAKLEEETKRVMTQLKSEHAIKQLDPKKIDGTAASNGEDLIQRSLEIARLEAQISKNNDYYQKLPRRKFIGARTQEFRFAQYIEDWRVKVERIGNLNYPAQARLQKAFGSLQLSVSIRADGSIEKVEINHSSGQRILDAAALRIVKLAAPYSPLPPDITKDTDILTITRTWTFTASNQLESE
ncbi:MAG: energy transducer TonB [Gallionella sp.]|nr:energy transducer TonB [Gallionella sp.]